MKTVLLLVDAGGDKLRVDVPEKKDMMFAACGAVCNVQIGKREFVPNEKQLTKLIRVLLRVSAGLYSTGEEAAASISDASSLVWELRESGVWCAVAGEYRFVVRPSLVHADRYVGFVNGSGQTSITAGDDVATVDEAKAAVVAALRDYLVETRRRIDVTKALIDNRQDAPSMAKPEWQSAGGTAWLSIGSFRVVLRLELNGSCTGWIDRNYTQITDAQTFDTWETGKVVMVQSLRDYIANEVRELGQVAASLGCDK